MKIHYLVFSSLLINGLNGMQPGLQEIGPDGIIYDICQTTGIRMKLITTPEANPTNPTNHQPIPGILQAIHDEINQTSNKSTK